MSNLFGNPHSFSTASQLSGGRIDDIRLKTLHFFKADPDHFDLIFVANATAGIKLVMEAFQDHEGGFWYGYHKDSHTSMVGVREAAKAGQRCFMSDVEVEEWLGNPKTSGNTVPTFSHFGLFAYPAQSGMNGRRLPLSWPGKIRASSDPEHDKIYTLLDAAAYASTSPLNLGDVSCASDYTVLSFYKIFGFPDLGALIVRKKSEEPLSSRRYFSGGTVEMVSCITEQWHVKKQNSLHEQHEDGTLPIHNIIALGCALDIHKKLYGSITCISRHTTWLAKILYDKLSALRHGNGSEVCRIYNEGSSAYGSSCSQGPVIALNFLESNGKWVSNTEVEKLACIKNIQLRSGGLCNPGGIMTFLQLTPSQMRRNYSAGQRCGSEGDVIGEKPTGAIRLSLGAMSTLEDVTKLMEFVEQFFVNAEVKSQFAIEASPGWDYMVEDLMIYPIKSCGGWSIPPHLRWDVSAKGLAWDREWCLVHEGTRVALSQKQYPQMALLKPSIDINGGFLRVRYHGSRNLAVSEISISLTADPSSFRPPSGFQSQVYRETMKSQIYASEAINQYFSTAIGISCLLARYSPPPFCRTPRTSKLNLLPLRRIPPAMPGTFPTSQSVLPAPFYQPLNFSNESPILTISRSSLNRLNEEIRTRHGKEATAAVFRANIILAPHQAGTSGIVERRPYAEDGWRSLLIGGVSGRSTPGSYQLKVLGGCRRCQMVCVDQSNGEKNEEPFVTLAKTRRRNGKVFFGVHTALVDGSGYPGEEGEKEESGSKDRDEDRGEDGRKKSPIKAKIQIGDLVKPILLHQGDGNGNSNGDGDGVENPAQSKQ